MNNPSNRELLRIYLQDHYAGAQVGVELARRATAANDDNAFGDRLRDLCLEIDEDREALQSIMLRFDVTPDRTKVAAAWLGEKLGRLKLNGQLTGYSPLSRLVELEGLAIGIAGKLALWQTLAHLLEPDEPLRAAVDRLIERAEQQRERVEELRLQALELALGDQRSIEKARTAG